MKPAYAPVFELDQDAVRCPYSHFEQARRDAPVSWYEDGGFWVVTEYDLITEVLKKPNVFSNRQQIGKRADEIWQKMVRFAAEDPSLPKKVDGYGNQARRAMMMTDPPDNEDHRSLVTGWLLGKQIKAQEPVFESTAREHVDGLLGRREVEFCREFGDLYSMAVIADILGLPKEHRGRLTEWTKDINAMMGNDRISDDEIRTLSRGRFEFDAYFAEVILDRRAHPRDDLSTSIVQNNDALANPLSDDELLMIFQLMVVGGSDTTAAMLARVMEDLAEQPDLWTRLRADRSLVPNYLEGVLRLKGPVLGMFRTATEDVELGGETLREGDFVWLSLVSGNYDEKRFDSFALDVDQHQTPRHLTLGLGAHKCVGAVLSRLEMRIALDALLDRFTAVRIAPGHADPRPYRPSFLLHGPAEVWLELDRDRAVA